jgi:hypothetical protein
MRETRQSGFGGRGEVNPSLLPLFPAPFAVLDFFELETDFHPIMNFKTGLALTLCLGFHSGSALSAADSPAAVAITPSGQVELFNGKDFSGWTFFMRTNADPKQTWSVQDGIIKCTGTPAGYMRTERPYRDYKLTIEWRFVRAAGNTGVLLHTVGPDKVWPKCIEAQGGSGNQGDFIALDGAEFNESKAAGNRRVPKRGESAEKPIGEWNTYEIICAGDTIKASVNGRLMNEATGSSVSSGWIGLQSEGTEIEIRKIVLEPAGS